MSKRYVAALICSMFFVMSLSVAAQTSLTRNRGGQISNKSKSSRQIKNRILSGSHSVKLESEIVKYVISKIEEGSSSSSRVLSMQGDKDPLIAEANHLFGTEEQRQISEDLDKRLGPWWKGNRTNKLEELLSEIDKQFSADKLNEIRENLNSEDMPVRLSDATTKGLPWPLCVIKRRCK